MCTRWVVAMLAVAFMPGSAFADEESGLYLGVGWGQFSSGIDNIEDLDEAFDEDTGAYKIFGGWRFAPWLSVQLDYMDLGDADTDFTPGRRFEVSTKTWAPSVVGTLPIGFVELFASAGLLYYDVETTLNGNEVSDESDRGEVYSVGVGITVLERLALRLEYQMFEIDELDDSDTIWLTGAWRF